MLPEVATTEAGGNNVGHFAPSWPRGAHRLEPTRMTDCAG